MSTSNYDAIPATDIGRWHEVLNQADGFDFYHLPEYHLVAEERGEGTGVLFFYREASQMIAWPFLLRPLKAVAGLEVVGRELQDATSVYGYPGPVFNRCPPERSMRRFAASLLGYFESERVIAAFSRLHPFFDQEPCLEYLDGQVLSMGPTVAIDLSLPVEVQRQQYRTNHKRDINKARRKGITCIHDKEWRYFDSFIDIYYETMRRTDAGDYYFFDQTYFVRLRELLGNCLHLSVALKDGLVSSGALFTVCNSIIQYHLGGTDSRYLALAPSKLIFDTVRLWGNEIGARILHLGGGVGSREDSLFLFKAGFSKLRYQFKVWRMVVNPVMYRQLVQQKRAWNKANGLEAMYDDYFPAYRCPTQAIS